MENKREKMKFSIITVVYNNVNEIEQTIKSVLLQNFPKENIEYIIIDGGSTDGTCDIIKKYEKYISYWQSEADSGIYDAMNKGIDKAGGDIVAFLNSGDWYENNALDIADKAFVENKADIIYGKVNRIVKEKVCGTVCQSTVDGDYEQLHIRNLFCHQGMFIKRSLFIKYGKFDLQYQILADYDWNLKAYNSGVQIKVIPQTVANYRVGGLSDTVDSCEEYRQIVYTNLNGREDLIPKIEQELDGLSENFILKKILKKNPYVLYELINKDKIYYIWGMGGNLKICLDIFEKLNITVSGIIDRDAKVSKYDDIQVYRSQSEKVTELLSNEGACCVISSTDYEREIRKELNEKKINKNNIISLAEIQKRIKAFAQSAL